MPNGRALPTALLFDELLGRAWNIALSNYGEAQGLQSPNIPDNLGKVDGAYALPNYKSTFNGGGAAGAVAAHDASVKAQLDEVAKAWATEFAGVMTAVAPVGPGFKAAVAWLSRVAAGGDGLGYVGHDHRIAQHQQQANVALAGLNARALPMPAGAFGAMQAVGRNITGLYGSRLVLQLDADREAARRKLVIDAVEALAQLRNAALDAAMDYVFGQVNMMFDVFGNSNEFLTRIRREEQAMQARMQVATAELARWDASVQGTHDATLDDQRKLKAVSDRTIQKAEMTVEQHIKRLRRYSSRAASALNSAGVSVDSSASETNNIDAQEA